MVLLSWWASLRERSWLSQLKQILQIRILYFALRRSTCGRQGGAWVRGESTGYVQEQDVVVAWEWRTGTLLWSPPGLHPLSLPALTQASLCDSISAEIKKSSTVWLCRLREGPWEAAALCTDSQPCPHPALILQSGAPSVSKDAEKCSRSLLSAQMWLPFLLCLPAFIFSPVFLHPCGLTFSTIIIFSL